MRKSVLIKIKKIKKSFGKKLVLNNINLNIHNGEIIGIVGKSGVGKTTLLKTIIGFLEPDKGEILFKPKPGLVKSKYLKYFGFSTQEKSFYSKLTVKENLTYFASIYDLPKSNLNKIMNSILKDVRLVDEKNTIAGNLSQGMQKRLDIACSIMHDPKILIIDEPTADLDPVLRKQIISLIRSLNYNKDKTIIISSHIPQELSPICDRVFLLQNKKIKRVDALHNISGLYG